MVFKRTIFNDETHISSFFLPIFYMLISSVNKRTNKIRKHGLWRASLSSKMQPYKALVRNI